MKEPILVNLMIQQDEDKQFTVQFPLKKVNQMCTITKERLIRFLITQKIIQKEDQDKIKLEFYDFKSQGFVPEKLLFVSHSNQFEFTEIFLGSPNELTLKISLCYDMNYQKIREIDQILEVYEKEKAALQQNQDSLQEEFERQKEQLYSMKNDLLEIKQLIKQNISQTQDNLVDIVILYSNPLLRMKEGIQEALFVDYQSEIEEITKSIDNAGRPIKYKIMLASKSNLEQAISYHPIVIHLVLHGDYDEQSAYFYLQFQEDGLASNLPTNEIQNIIRNSKGIKRTKLICISSIICQNLVEYLSPIIYEVQVQVVGYQKLFNTKDDLCKLFWGTFYKRILSDDSIEDSYKYSQEVIQDQFWQKKELQKICCCFHKHFSYCPFDPALKGYEYSHQKHLPCCLIQQFEHGCLELKKTKSKFQCPSGCLGQIKHKVKEGCRFNDDQQCLNYEERFEIMLESLQCDIDGGMILNLNSSLTLPGAKQIKLGCCCDQIKSIYEQVNEPQSFDSGWTQHLVDQKAFVFSPVGHKQNEILFESKNQQDLIIQTVKYSSIDKQIIILHSKQNPSQDEQNQVHQKILEYFKTYYKIMNPNRVEKIHILNFSQCDPSKWKDYVAEELSFTNDNDEVFFNNLQLYLKEYNQKQDLYNIFVVHNIEKIYNSELFARFYEHLQSMMASHFILLLTVNNVLKDKLKELAHDYLVQLIDMDYVKPMLGEKN